MFRSPSQPIPHHTPGTIDLVISNPVVLLNEIARRYETTERILMEYVDNALDDAEVLYRQNSDAYPYPIEIDLTVDFSAATITIGDNCRGMNRNTLEGLVRNIGESTKRGLTWVNGRFGFGVHAFRAAAEHIRFQTKHAHSSHHILEFHRDQFAGIKEAQRTDDPFPGSTGTGTLVTLSKLDPEWFSTVTVESIQQEIERHFERLLDRPNLSVRVREAGQTPVICQPFDYAAIAGQEIIRSFTLTWQQETYPIELYLKIAAEPGLARSPSFFARGRRVAAVTEIKSFMRKSRNTASLWGHPHLMGYIEVGELLQPILNRDDFVRTKRRQMLYEAIVELEPEIRRGLGQVIQVEQQSTLGQITHALRQALADTSSMRRPLPGLEPQSPAIALVDGLEGANDRRAILQNGVLQINLAHPDFKRRLNSLGAPRLTDRMIAYLAGVLATYSRQIDPTITETGNFDPQGALEAQLTDFLQIEENLRRQRIHFK